MQKSQKTLQQLKALKNKVEHYEGLVTKYEDILTLIEMGIEEDDDSIYEEEMCIRDSLGGVPIGFRKDGNCEGSC